MASYKKPYSSPVYEPRLSWVARRFLVVCKVTKCKHYWAGVVGECTHDNNETFKHNYLCVNTEVNDADKILWYSPLQSSNLTEE